MEKWNVRKSETLIHTPFVQVKKEGCELPNGTYIEDYVTYEYPDWVNAIVLTKAYKLILVYQYRHGANDSFLEIPAGKKESGETDREGIIREVKEETGYSSAADPIYLGEFHVNPALQNNKVKTFLLLDAEQGSEQELNNTEDIRVTHIDFEEFGTKSREGIIQTQLFSMHAYLLARDYLENNRT